MTVTRYLDTVGRWILATCEYRVLGIFVILVLIVFSLWRRYRYESWPTREDYYHLAVSLVGSVGGFTAAVVFLFTKPPAIDLLSGPTLLFLGVIVPIVVIGHAFPRLKVLFFPPEAPKPPQVVAENERSAAVIDKVPQ